MVRHKNGVSRKYHLSFIRKLRPKLIRKIHFLGCRYREQGEEGEEEAAQLCENHFFDFQVREKATEANS
jgi:hypothetical protein